ncbi:MAG: GAF domain-containing protein [Chloroflexi bacterium]|nr:GAF domain-containing protein [Chloroflexota bacterium]
MSTKKPKSPKKTSLSEKKSKAEKSKKITKNKNRIVKETEKLFEDLGNLAAEETPADSQRIKTTHKALSSLLSDPSTKLNEELDTLRLRIKELEALEQNQAGYTPTPSLYEKERISYAYKENRLQALTPSELSENYQPENLLQAPLTSTGKKIGEMIVDLPTEKPLNAEDKKLLNTIAEQASLQIQSLRLLSSAERARTEAEEATRKFMHQNWEAYLDAINKNERIGYAYDQSSVTPYLDSTKEDTYEESVQIMDEQIGKLALKNDPTNPLSDSDKKIVASVANQIAQQVENLRLLADASRARSEAEEATRRLTHESWRDFTQRKEDEEALSYIYDTIQVAPTEGKPLPENVTLSVPLEVRGATIGHLAAAGDKSVSQDAQNLAAEIATQASIHIENLRLLDETEYGRQQLNKRAAELETVAKVSTAAAAIRDPKSLLRSVVDLTNYSFELYHTSVYLVDNEEDGTEILKLSAASGKTGHKMLQKGLSFDQDEKNSIVARAAQKNNTVIVTDTTNDPLFLAHESLPDTKSALAVPMIVADKLIGVFNVEADTPNRFSKEDEQTYITLAAQTAVALQNARLYEEQIETVARLRELDHLKSSFLANMSHELRTPLNSISGFTQVMLEGLDGPLSPEMEEDLGLIDKNANHLLSLINEVLDMAKIEAGRLSVTLGPANMYEVIDDVVKTTAPLARQNNLSISLKNDIPEELILMADDMRMKQVMINIIGNAMKFTQEGTIQVEAKKIDGKIRIQVSDTGIGIPPELLETIFEAFSQVDTSTTRKVGGTGLGLPISRRFIEMHNGRLWAESSGISGEGSTFIVEIPVVVPEAT